MKFVLLLTLWGEMNVAVETHVVLDNLTGAECIELLTENHNKAEGVLSCEVDYHNTK